MSSSIIADFCFHLLKKSRVCSCHCARLVASSSSTKPSIESTQLQQARAAPSSSLPNLSSNVPNIDNTSFSQNTADYAELELFEDISSPSDWFDENNGAFKPLHSFNRVRIPWILAHFGNNLTSATANSKKPPLAGKKILDVGCGAGILSLALCRLGAEVIGIDAAENVIEIAQQAKKTLPAALRGNVHFVQKTLEEYTAEERNCAAFHGVVASEVVEHVLDLPSLIHCICRLAKPNSPLFFTTINRTIWSNLMAIVLAENILKLLPKGIHSYDKFVTPEELQKLLIDERCSRIGPVLGLSYNPLFSHWSWSSFTAVNYALVAYTGKQ